MKDDNRGNPPQPAANEPPDDLVTPTRAAQILRLHVSSIYRWIFQRKVRSWTRGQTRRLVSEAEIRAQVQRFIPPPLPPRRPSA